MIILECIKMVQLADHEKKAEKVALVIPEIVRRPLSRRLTKIFFLADYLTHTTASIIAIFTLSLVNKDSVTW